MIGRAAVMHEQAAEVFPGHQEELAAREHDLADSETGKAAAAREEAAADRER
jgi:hypothetical protein